MRSARGERAIGGLAARAFAVNHDFDPLVLYLSNASLDRTGCAYEKPFGPHPDPLKTRAQPEAPRCLRPQ